MPTFALYSRPGAGPQTLIDSVVAFLQENRCRVVAHRNISCKNTDIQRFESYEELKQLGTVDFMVSIGGDGSFIDAANLIGDLGIPLVGVNTGRIGFLSATPAGPYHGRISASPAGWPVRFFSSCL